MKLLFSLPALLLSYIGFGQTTATRPNADTKGTKTLYDYSAKTIDGKILNFKSFKGKKVLIVNTASECGYTPQYADLQELHKKYGIKLVIIGFPCNQFGEQEPGTNADIKSFCSKNYNVSFQMMEKVDVKGSKQHPVYKWLSDSKLNGWNTSVPEWNFVKYLIDENGGLIGVFGKKTNPMSEEITSKL